MKDSFPFKIYTSTGLIISECSTAIQAIARAKQLNCEWVEAYGQQVGHQIDFDSINDRSPSSRPLR